jgi:hypothetical protein
MNVFWKEFCRAVKQAPRLYFAPLVGAAKAVRWITYRLIQKY